MKTSQQEVITHDACVMLAEAMGWKPNLEEYRYHWATNRRKSSGEADAYFDDPNWEHMEERFFRDDHTDNYCFRIKLSEPKQDGWLRPVPAEDEAGGFTKVSLIDPFVVSQDFLVLEWMRSSDANLKRFGPELWHWRFADYHPSAWAKIAIKVLREEQHSV